MSAPKYTPGPWDACEDEPSVGAYRNGIASHVAACGMEQGHSHHIPLDEAFANARLIAAAPELLEALKWAIRRLEISIGPSHCCGAHWERAQAAIAKAEGRSE